MTKLMVTFLTFILEGAAIIFLVVGGYGGYVFAIENNPESIGSMLIYSSIGVVIGFMIATITLGVLSIILRINQNLEDISATLNEINRNLEAPKENNSRNIPVLY